VPLVLLSFEISVQVHPAADASAVVKSLFESSVVGGGVVGTMNRNGNEQNMEFISPFLN
jgi:hypothetical protein